MRPRNRTGLKTCFNRSSNQTGQILPAQRPKTPNPTPVPNSKQGRNSALFSLNESGGMQEVCTPLKHGHQTDQQNKPKKRPKQQRRRLKKAREYNKRLRRGNLKTKWPNKKIVNGVGSGLGFAWAFAPHYHLDRLGDSLPCSEWVRVLAPSYGRQPH